MNYKLMELISDYIRAHLYESETKDGKWKIATIPSQIQAIADDYERTKQNYQELIYAVGNKYKGETRHQTALRYIVEAENTRSEEAGEAKEEI